jgi:hypothetical protein
VQVYGISLPAGMSGGWYFQACSSSSHTFAQFPVGHESLQDWQKKYNATPATYAAAVAAVGFDWVLEQSYQDAYDGWNDAGDELVRALSDVGVGFGTIPRYVQYVPVRYRYLRAGIAPDNFYQRMMMCAEIAFYAATVADYHGPLYRDIQLQACDAFSSSSKPS